jgi:hypothetical protein
LCDTCRRQLCETLIDLIGEATMAGARQAPTCEMLGLSAPTVQRWQRGEPDAVESTFYRVLRESLVAAASLQLSPEDLKLLNEVSAPAK